MRRTGIRTVGTHSIEGKIGLESPYYRNRDKAESSQNPDERHESPDSVCSGIVHSDTVACTRNTSASGPVRSICTVKAGESRGKETDEQDKSDDKNDNVLKCNTKGAFVKPFGELFIRIFHLFMCE